MSSSSDTHKKEVETPLYSDKSGKTMHIDPLSMAFVSLFHNIHNTHATLSSSNFQETHACELVPAAAAEMANAIRNYNEVLTTLPALGARSVGAETKEMKVAQDYLESRTKWWNECMSMCSSAKQAELKKK